MRVQTMAIRDILKSKYPTGKFKLAYKTTHNYIDRSDRVVVKCDKNIDVDEVIKLLKEYTSGIGIYKTGSMAMSRGAEPKIYAMVIDEWIDTDLMEFIEVGNY